MRWRPFAGQLALVLALLALADGVAAERQLLPAVALTPNRTAYGCPQHAVFDNPWVRQNVALTYGLQIRDGLGSQTARMMGVYAIAAASGLHYVHSPFQCIGHIGGLPHYRNRGCTHLAAADQQRLQRISRHIQLPSSTTANVTAWDSVTIFRGNWAALVRAVTAAAASKRPTLIKLELVDEFISVCPDIFYHVEAWRPHGTADSKAISNASPWLFTAGRSCRIVVHMRRGDLSVASANRELPTTYYMNVVKNLIKVLDSVNQDYHVEWFTEPPSNTKERDDMRRIRSEIPHSTIMYDSDLLWTWQQMWTSDIFIMSKSGYSFVPAIVNVDAIIIHAPALGIRKCKIACSPSHWLEAQDEAGNLPPELVAEVLRRTGCRDSSRHPSGCSTA